MRNGTLRRKALEVRRRILSDAGARLREAARALTITNGKQRHGSS